MTPVCVIFPIPIYKGTGSAEVGSKGSKVNDHVMHVAHLLKQLHWLVGVKRLLIFQIV